MKFGLKHYWKPTPLKMRKLGDSIAVAPEKLRVERSSSVTVFLERKSNRSCLHKYQMKNVALVVTS